VILGNFCLRFRSHQNTPAQDSYGYSVNNLEHCRNFYTIYPKLAPPASVTAMLTVSEILQAPGKESWQPGRLHPNLSWTHYRSREPFSPCLCCAKYINPQIKTLPPRSPSRPDEDKIVTYRVIETEGKTDDSRATVTVKNRVPIREASPRTGRRYNFPSRRWRIRNRQSRPAPLQRHENAAFQGVRAMVCRQ